MGDDCLFGQPEAGCPDVVDKELAYLLYKTLHQKSKVHCLLVMDCCHSADNTRSLAPREAQIQNRQVESSGLKLALSDYLGYNEGFYEIEDGRLKIKPARYVHMAACRDDEEARDTWMADYSPVNCRNCLWSGATVLSYRNLERSLAATVAIANSMQHPVTYASTDEDLDLPFISGEPVKFKPTFEVRFNAAKDRWEMIAGRLQGIAPSQSPTYRTMVEIEGTDIKRR
ncbi:hypothetical protein [Chitinophaga pinensis]|uniref:Caspase family protein n=1 Tax=Chitinophaga pinensis TaxID=79329 RepID=A0A5C6LJY2_9BACT|nr:hypothetical protein [Chitinophaga pinensis]TWV93953.1 hypothetical protein FEF09_26325 [Chitinophaga pinensis]